METEERTIEVIRLFNGQSLPKPRFFIDKKQVNPFALPLQIEIGAGTGQFAIDQSHQHPAQFWIAIEHTKEKFQKFWNAYQKLSPEHQARLLPVHANAISWIYYFFLEERSKNLTVVENFHFMYPNPNPKNVASRWHRMPFFHVLLGLLKSRGCVHLATNEEWYADEAKLYLGKTWGLQEKSFQKIHKDTMQSDFIPRTLFEKKYFLRGDTCYDMIFSRS